MVYSLNNIRDENITLFDDLFIEFSKLELTRFYSAKSKTLYHNKSFSKYSYNETIRAAMTRKYKNLKKRKEIKSILILTMISLRVRSRITYSMIHFKIMILLRSIMKRMIILIFY